MLRYEGKSRWSPDTYGEKRNLRGDLHIAHNFRDLLVHSRWAEADGSDNLYLQHP